MGPAVKDVETIKELLRAGMNIARFNCAHGDHAYHKEMMDIIRTASRETGIPVAFLLDTKGPEIRTGYTKDNQDIVLENGGHIILTVEDVPCTDKVISLTYKNLPNDVKKGIHIFIADGIVDLEVEKVENNEVHCLIVNGGKIGSRKNVNIIGVKTNLPAITEKDVKDIIFGAENNVDFIAASFIRKATDIKEIRSIIDLCDVKIDIIAKIEDQEGLDNIDDIIRVSDGIMVARGDLGVQLPAEEIPLVQKRIISKCNDANKPVITATQMLDSMISNPIPTRAEVTDVANAVFDGTDAVMLSGETANGSYPVKAVEIMQKIAYEAENSVEYKNKERQYSHVKMNVADTMSISAFLVAKDINASAIIAPTLHGNTPKIISKYRPNQHIIAVTPYEEVKRKLLLYWGVYPIISEFASDSDTMIDNAIKAGQKAGFLKDFDKVVILAGIPLNSPIMLNTIRIHMLVNVIGKSSRGYGKTISGRIVKVKDIAEAENAVRGDGDEILLARYIDESFMPILKKVKGYILEEFSSMSWEEIYKVNPNLVALAGARSAMNNLSSGQIVTIDGEEKLIYEGKAGY